MKCHIIVAKRVSLGLALSHRQKGTQVECVRREMVNVRAWKNNVSGERRLMWARRRPKLSWETTIAASMCVGIPLSCACYDGGTWAPNAKNTILVEPPRRRTYKRSGSNADAAGK